MKSQTTKPGPALSPTANSKPKEKSASKLPIAERGQGKQMCKRPAAAESAAALKRPAAALKRPASELAAEPASLKCPSAAESSEPAAELAAKPAKRPAAADTELDDLDEKGESEEPVVDEEGESEDAAEDPEAAGSDAPDSEPLPDSFGKQKQLWVARKAEQLHQECGRTKAQAQKEANDNWMFSKERRLLLDTMPRAERSRRRLKHPEE